ncbi:thioredoxin family protein [Candidatus Accumulibacter sp. ACC003]|uniref:thioredoxin family protein n=1 Tax=Candidatus Accumulibacter sp. ACC003 TaxID=2823334 RepID=UPI0025C22988|nr:thioredoxin family protein [Candidatus Accumulibacter sp. ACC003]
MKEVKVLGPGCARCKAVSEMVKQVAEQTGVAINLEKVEDMARIVGYGVMSTPGLVIDGQLVHSGGLPDPKKVAAWLQKSG